MYQLPKCPCSYFIASAGVLFEGAFSLWVSLTFSVLNVYQINIFQSLQFMHKIKNKDPGAFYKNTGKIFMYHAMLILPIPP